MTKQVDLNADMGESFGDWVMGNDAALLDIVTSANIACGFHAGDPDVMARTMRMAVEKGVGIGAHPGFADLPGFGRRRMSLSAESLQNSIRYQLGAAQAMARAVVALCDISNCMARWQTWHRKIRKWRGIAMRRRWKSPPTS